MKYPKCESDDRERVKFCKRCGSKLETSCSACRRTSRMGRSLLKLLARRPCEKATIDLSRHRRPPFMSSDQRDYESREYGFREIYFYYDSKGC